MDMVEKNWTLVFPPVLFSSSGFLASTKFKVIVQRTSFWIYRECIWVLMLSIVVHSTLDCWSAELKGLCTVKWNQKDTLTNCHDPLLITMHTVNFMHMYSMWPEVEHFMAMSIWRCMDEHLPISNAKIEFRLWREITSLYVVMCIRHLHGQP